MKTALILISIISAIVFVAVQLYLVEVNRIAYAIVWGCAPFWFIALGAAWEKLELR